MPDNPTIPPPPLQSLRTHLTAPPGLRPQSPFVLKPQPPVENSPEDIHDLAARIVRSCIQQKLNKIDIIGDRFKVAVTVRKAK